MTKKKTIYLNGELTYAEKKVLLFLESNKGTEFSNDEIEEATNIQVTYINSIIRNLRLKGYEIITNRRKNKHEYKANSLASYLLTGAILLIIAFIFVYAGLDYLAADPVVYDIEPIIER